MPEVNETDFAIVVFREDDGWDADVLPVAVTDDLKGFIRVLRQQPSIAGTIGLAGIDDYFFVAVRVVGSQISVLLSDIGAALDYPLAEQVLDYLEIPVPDEDDLDQVLPVGDLSIFADLGLDEMDLAAICSRLDFDSDDDPWDHVEDAVESIAVRLGFGPAMERALDTALGALRSPAAVAGEPVTGYEATFEPAMRAALAEAGAAAAAGDVPVGAVVVDGAGTVLARGRNRREADGDPTAHAELIAIRAAARAVGRWRLDGLTLVVTLEPCTMCAGAVTTARLSRLVFGAADPRAGAVGSVWDVVRDQRTSPVPEVIGGPLAAECRAVLTRFFGERR